MGKRILFCVGGHRSYGSEQKMMRIMKGLKMRGHKIYCVTQGWSDGSFQALLNKENIPFISLKLGFFYLRKPFWTLDSLWHYPRAIWRLCKLIREFKPQIIYHNSFKNLLVMSPFLPKEKVLLHVGDTLPVTNRYRQIFAYLSKNVHRWAAISNYVKQNLQELGVIKPISIIYNGVEAIQPSAEFVNSKKKIGVVGHLLPNKGQEDLIRAAALLAPKYPKLEYCFIGDGDSAYIHTLQNLIGHLNLQKYFEFTGYLQNKEDIYGRLSIAVICSRREALGNAAIEPMFAGVPVISSNAGGLTEVVISGETGLLYKAGDYEGLAAQLDHLLTDSKYMERLQNRASAVAKEMFSIEAMLDNIEVLLEQYD
jgi:L-malate glycosyltransferase